MPTDDVHTPECECWGCHFHRQCLAIVELLVELDPPADSPEGRLLWNMSAAVEEYEKQRFPL